MNMDNDRLWGRLQQLAEIGSVPGRKGVTRPGFSPLQEEAVRLVGTWMREAGLNAGIDDTGNLVGVLPGRSPGLPAIGLGSHLDTVPDGGAFDGALGVLAALEAVQKLHEEGTRLEHPLAVIGFADEEGVNFGIGVLSAQLWNNEIKPEEFGNILDSEGRSLEDHISSFNPEGLPRVARLELGAFVEAHIEQGPVLEREGAAAAAVTAIVGVYRTTVHFHGSANHAGTTPMNERRDALWPAAELILAVRELALETNDRAVATVGELEVRPGATNVVPGSARLRIELRSADAGLLAELVDSIDALIQSGAAKYGVSAEVDEWHKAEPVPLHPQVIEAVNSGLAAAGLPEREMPSWAGHDTKVMARHVPSGMLFIPSPGGISHSPHETSTPEDCNHAAEILLHSVRHLDRSLPAGIVESELLND